jgi:4-hydroxy-3-polyprenylbenzoate decarboxylase
MPYRCLAEFLEELSHLGEICRVENDLDPVGELADYSVGANLADKNALLFVGVRGHDLPVLANLFAAESRICRALGVSAIGEMTDRIARLLDDSAPEGWFERFKGGTQRAAVASVAPREVKSAACQQIVRLGNDVDLAKLPLLSCGASVPPALPRAINGAVVFSAEPDTHRPVAARFDLQQLDATRLAVCWAAHDDHARLLAEYRARNQKMPLAVVIGGDPAFLLAASAPLPPGSDLCAVAGLLRQKSLDVVACRSVDLAVPAEAEIVLEGHVDPAEPPVTAGPLCGPTGHATAAFTAPVLHVAAITHRANPIYVAMIPGRPPHEAITVARAMQRAFLPLTRLAMPELIDYDMPAFAAARHWAALSIRKTYAGQARRAAHAAWGLRPLMFAKMLVVVDDDIDVRDQQAVLSAVASNMNPGRDVLIDQGPLDPFDPAATAGALGQRMAIDATRKLPTE